MSSPLLLKGPTWAPSTGLSPPAPVWWLRRPVTHAGPGSERHAGVPRSRTDLCHQTHVLPCWPRPEPFDLCNAVLSSSARLNADQPTRSPARRRRTDESLDRLVTEQ